MKLIILTFSTLFSVSVFADWDLPRFNRNDTSNGGLRTVWSCPVNRGDMPELREVEIYYAPNGQLAFRPDIFRGSFSLFRIFRKRRSSANVDECLRSFMITIPQAVSNYQEARCSGSSDPVCNLSAQQISGDASRKIRTSSFYKKYQNDLASVQDLFPGPVISERPVTPQTPVVANTPVTIRPFGKRIIARPEENPDLARTRLLDYMIDNYSKIADVKEFARFCPQMGNTTGANAAYCQDRHSRNNVFLTNLSQMFTAVRGEPITQARLLQSTECLPPSVGEFRDLEDILNKLDQKDECSPLNVGDHKLFRKAPGGTPAWYTSGNYLLKKTSDDTYEATLNLDFVSAGGTMSSQEMLARVQSCLAHAGPSLRGGDGSRLNIKVLSPQQIEAQIPRSERPLPELINIIPDQVRLENGTMTDNEINSENFHSGIDCPTVTHEILHHLGFCDEYREERTNIVPGLTRSRAVEWSCRVVPSAPSIMNNHVQVYNAAVPQQLSCECVNDGCRNTLRGSDARSVASRKILMTSTSYDLLGGLSSICATPEYLPTVDDIPEPDKAFTNIVSRPGVLSFQSRSILNENGRFRISPKNITCTCPEGQVGCPAALARVAALMARNPSITTCPLHTQKSSDNSTPSQGATTSINDNGFTFVTTPQMSSLLSPNQFDKILTGNCRQGPSSLYKRCAEFAYIAQDSSTCSEKPAECGDDNQYLGRGSEQ
jgi:hypothetical protein